MYASTQPLFTKARVMRSARAGCRLPTLPLLFADDLEERDGYKTFGSWYQRVASLVPFGVVFATNNMEEVAFMEG